MPDDGNIPGTIQPRRSPSAQRTGWSSSKAECVVPPSRPAPERAVHSDGCPVVPRRSYRSGVAKGVRPGEFSRARDCFGVRYLRVSVGRSLTWLRAMTRATPPRAAHNGVARSRLPHRLAGGDELELVSRCRTCSTAESARVPRRASVGRTHPAGPKPGVLEPRQQPPRRPESGRAVPGRPAGRARRPKPANGRLAVRRRGTSVDEQHHRRRDLHARRPA